MILLVLLLSIASYFSFVLYRCIVLDKTKANSKAFNDSSFVISVLITTVVNCLMKEFKNGFMTGLTARLKRKERKIDIFKGQFCSSSFAGVKTEW